MCRHVSSVGNKRRLDRRFFAIGGARRIDQRCTEFHRNCDRVIKQGDKFYRGTIFRIGCEKKIKVEPLFTYSVDYAGKTLSNLEVDEIRRLKYTQRKRRDFKKERVTESREEHPKNRSEQNSVQNSMEK